LNLEKNITELETPVILNASGLWKIKIDFTLEKDSYRLLCLGRCKEMDSR
jgi:hypothetical protein